MNNEREKKTNKYLLEKQLETNVINSFIIFAIKMIRIKEI